MKLVHTSPCAVDYGLHRLASARHRRQQQGRQRAARRQRRSENQRAA